MEIIDLCGVYDEKKWNFLHMFGLQNLQGVVEKLVQ